MKFSLQQLDRIQNASRFFCVLLAVWVPIAIWGALHATTDSARVHDWLPDSHEARTQYEDFLRRFGDDQYLIVAWPGVKLHDPRLDSFVERLRSADTGGFFDTIESSSAVYERLIAEPLKLPDSEARRRLRGTLLGDDGTACALIAVSPVGVEHGTEVLERIREVSETTPGLERVEIKLAGTLFEEVMVDEASHRSLVQLAPPSTLAAIVVAMVVLGSLVDGLLVLVLAGIGQLTAIALLYFSGGQFSAVLIVLPTLVFMLTLSSAIHLINYARSADEKHDDHTGARAFGMGIKPTLLASLTTAVGMLSLASSHLDPVRQFGLYSAGCLVVSTSILVAGFPAVCDWLARCKMALRRRDASTRSCQVTRFTPLAKALNRFDLWVCCLGAVLLTVAVCGVVRMQASTKFDAMFSTQTTAIKNMQWIEEHIGPLISVELALRFPDKPEDLLQQVRWVATIQRALKDMPAIGTAASAIDFMPPIPRGSGVRSAAARSVFVAALRDSLDDLESQGWVHSVGQERAWKVTCRIAAIGDTDYSDVASAATNSVQEILQQYSDQPNAPECLYATGLSPVIDETQEMLLSDLGASFLMAFVLITPIMMLITRSVVDGLLAMLPNVLPVAVVFGTLGWLGVAVDIAGILTASIALGISVDDTLHFISWYHHTDHAEFTPVEKLAYAFSHCATAMLQTTVVCCAAMVPFFFSEFLPTQRFAILMVCMLSGAIAGDLILLPAILSLRSRWVSNRKK